MRCFQFFGAQGELNVAQGSQEPHGAVAVRELGQCTKVQTVNHFCS